MQASQIWSESDSRCFVLCLYQDKEDVVNNSLHITRKCTKTSYPSIYYASPLSHVKNGYITFFTLSKSPDRLYMHTVETYINMSVG